MNLKLEMNYIERENLVHIVHYYLLKLQRISAKVFAKPNTVDDEIRENLKRALSYKDVESTLNDVQLLKLHEDISSLIELLYYLED